MTLRWIEGFERARHTTILERIYPVSTIDNIASLAGSRGGWGIQSDGLIVRTPELVSPDANTWVVGFAFMVAQTSGGLASSPDEIPYVSFLNASGEQLRLEFIDAGNGTTNSKPGGRYYRVRVMRGATEIARTDQIWLALSDTDSNWVYFEWKVTIDTGTGGSFSLKYHQQRKVKNQTATWDNSVTSINTANQGVAGADRVEVSFNTGTDGDSVAFDDIYILDSAGTKNNDFLGEIFIEGLTVTGDGNTTDWVLAGGAINLADALNEGATVQSSIEDDNRLTSDTIGDISLGALSNLTDILSTTIVGVQVRAYGKMETTGSRDIQVMWRKTTGTPAQVGGAVETFDDTSIKGFADTQEDDPNTSTDWVHADVNGLEAGVEVDA